MSAFYLSIVLRNDTLYKVINELYVLSNNLIFSSLLTHKNSIISKLYIDDITVMELELSSQFKLSNIGNNYYLHFKFKSGEEVKHVGKLSLFLNELTYYYQVITVDIENEISGVLVE